MGNKYDRSTLYDILKDLIYCMKIDLEPAHSVLWKFKNPIVIIHQKIFVYVSEQLVGINFPSIWKFKEQFKTS